MIKTMSIRSVVPKGNLPGRRHIVRIRAPRRASIPGWRWIKAVTNRDASLKYERQWGAAIFDCACAVTGATFGRTRDDNRVGSVAVARWKLDQYHPAVVRATLARGRIGLRGDRIPARWKRRSR